ncbi:MAG TPA: hypothetical protein VN455_06565 [Methanotrichaceae archaeon]|nr:hypothetical protein [Methanotrichaceae archaeon]
MIPKCGFYAAFIAAVCFALIPAASGAPTLPSGSENPMPMRYPDLNSAPAPQWVTEGLRATYDMLASTSDFEGKAGEKTDVGSGSAGNGMVQIDVVAMENGLAATSTESYAPDLYGGMRKVNSYGSVAPVGIGDFWANPQVLQKIPEGSADDLTVLRIPFSIEGKNFQAIRFDFKSGTFEMAVVYDQYSGLLLYHTSDYSTEGEGDPGMVRTSGNHAILQLRNLRRLEIPWKDGSLPSWLAQGQTWGYQGQSVTQFQGTTPMASALASKVTVQEVHERFARLREDPYTQSSAAATYFDVVCSPSRLMGDFVPPEALSAATGIVDTDPDTGMQVSVARSGQDGIVLERTNQVDFREDLAYDSTGKLSQIEQHYLERSLTSNFGGEKVITMQLVS